MSISMTLFTKNIKLRDLLNVQVLSTRSTARKLFDEVIKKSSSQHFRLDFKDIAFASRSFMDELNVLAMKLNVTFQEVNMNEQIKKMAQLVKDTEKAHFTAIEEDDASQANLMSI